MRVRNKILTGLVITATAALVFFTVEMAIQIYLKTRKTPPKKIRVEVRPMEGEGAERRFMWRVFAGSHPDVMFEILPGEDLDENWDRFNEWFETNWGHMGEPPDEWWDQAYEMLEHLLSEAVKITREVEVAQFRRELEDL